MRTNFTMHEKYIKMFRGDTLSFGLKIKNECGTPQDFERVRFTCKSNQTDNRYIFQKSLGNGITKSGSGEYVVRVAPSDTKNAKAGKYFYDLEISAGDDVFTIMCGILEIEQDITI